MMLLVYILVWHYTIMYYGIGIVFGAAMFCFSFHVYYVRKLYRWVSLKPDFLGGMQICLAYQLPGLSVLICIKLIKLYKKSGLSGNLA